MLANLKCHLALDLQDPDLNFEEDEQVGRQAVSSLELYVPFRSEKMLQDLSYLLDTARFGVLVLPCASGWPQSSGEDAV